MRTEYKKGRCWFLVLLSDITSLVEVKGLEPLPGQVGTPPALRATPKPKQRSPEETQGFVFGGPRASVLMRIFRLTTRE